MQVRGIAWLGTRTAQFEQMVDFTTDVLGLAASHREDGLAIFPLENGDTLEIFDPQHEGGGHPDGVAGGFLVDSAEEAAAELKTKGVEVSDVGSAGEFRWVYFRAPDGNLYELTSGPYA
jgi:catechol 2,3-dioxygenase-like lactoylglutathione lyase family enzyme